MIEIDSLAAGGAGVGRLEGKVWLVEGGFPGERIAARIRSDRGRWVDAVATEVLRPAPGRRVPVCPIQSACGGCPWMPLEEAEQRRAKRTIVVDALERIGRLAGPLVEEVLSAGPVLRYRNRVEFAVGRDRRGARAVGFRPVGSASEVVDARGCHLQSEEGDAILGTIREFVLEGGGRADAGWDNPRDPVRVTVRVQDRGGGVTVVVRTHAAPIGSLGRLADLLLERHPNVRGVVRITTAAGRRGGGRIEVVRGVGEMEESAGGVPLRVPAGSFTQVQREGRDILERLVAEDGAGASRALELYGGTGGFGFALARRGVRVTVVEADASAVEAGRAAAARAGIDGRIDFMRGRVDEVLASFEPDAGDLDLIVADPPRSGLGEALSARVAALSAERIVLVSCDPATFARDARVLVREGYRLERVVPIDLFPQTPHVETVARFRRAGPALPRSRRESPRPPASG